ncbi:PREDICTED: receptor-type tyrosine-protein phosphatase F-like isoform X2 [Priapulus caudatus]|nr:PREDICTED: receptor-type tyrosine-protein phosphatase F-like isoform X2 [Priapulus caudatus]
MYKMDPPGSFRVVLLLCSVAVCLAQITEQLVWTNNVGKPETTLGGKNHDRTTTADARDPPGLEPWAVVFIVAVAIIFVFGMTALLIYAYFKDRAEGKLTFGRTTRNILRWRGGASTRIWRGSTVPVAHFPAYVLQMRKDNKGGFSAQFKEVQDVSPLFPTQVAELNINKPKNRYQHIGLPFDNSRVQLIPLTTEPGSDYINASFIPGCESGCEYVAAQGPLENTVNDFWRLIWEQQIAVIVMLTRVEEDGWKKCERYWPEEGVEENMGGFQVSLVSEKQTNKSIITRVFQMEKESQEADESHVHMVHSLQLLSWEELTKPACPDSVLALVDELQQIRVSALSDAERQKPVLVHGSAGVGRTGAFIAIDRLLTTAEHSKTLDVFKTVMELRIHRQRMVQTEEQYIFIHECIREKMLQRSNIVSISDEESVATTSKSHSVVTLPRNLEVDSNSNELTFVHGKSVTLPSVGRANASSRTNAAGADTRPEKWSSIDLQDAPAEPEPAAAHLTMSQTLSVEVFKMLNFGSKISRDKDARRTKATTAGGLNAAARADAPTTTSTSVKEHTYSGASSEADETRRRPDATDGSLHKTADSNPSVYAQRDSGYVEGMTNRYEGETPLEANQQLCRRSPSYQTLDVAVNEHTDTNWWSTQNMYSANDDIDV